MKSRKALLDVLLAADVPGEVAVELAALQPPSGGSWTAEVLNTGKVDEIKFAGALAHAFQTPLAAIEQEEIARPVLEIVCSRFVFKHQILPLAATGQTVRLATWDVFNLVARRFAAQQLPGRNIEWVLAPRGQLLRTIKKLYGVGAETFEELLQS